MGERLRPSPPVHAGGRGCGHSERHLVSSFRLFKLKKRYRNVLDTMFELLPRMARYRPPLSPRGQAPRGLRPQGGSWVVVGGEEAARRGLTSRV